MNQNQDMVIVHHGIKGQKWGVRRYQNADGSLTDAGIKRYVKQNRKTLNREILGTKGGNGELSKKNLKNLSKDEYDRHIKSFVDRRGAQMYNELLKRNSAVAKGRKIATAYGSLAVAGAAVAAASPFIWKKVVSTGIESALSKA